MKPIVIAYFWILLGVILFALAANDEQRGIASVAPWGGFNGVVYTANKADDPKQFHNLMTYQWIRASLVLASGIIFLEICRRADRIDPFSKHFAGKRELDELEKELDHEKEKRRRPLQ